MPARANIMKITTIELRTTSDRVGQETFAISASTAMRKSANFGMLTTRKLTHRPAASSTPGQESHDAQV